MAIKQTIEIPFSIGDTVYFIDTTDFDKVFGSSDFPSGSKDCMKQKKRRLLQQRLLMKKLSGRIS